MRGRTPCNLPSAIYCRAAPGLDLKHRFSGKDHQCRVGRCWTFGAVLVGCWRGLSSGPVSTSLRFCCLPRPTRQAGLSGQPAKRCRAQAPQPDRSTRQTFFACVAKAAAGRYPGRRRCHVRAAGALHCCVQGPLEIQKPGIQQGICWRRQNRDFRGEKATLGGAGTGERVRRAGRCRRQNRHRQAF